MSKVYKTVVTLEVLSPEPLDDFNMTQLSTLEYLITYGDCSGHMDTSASVALSDAAAILECDKHHTDPEFFGLLLEEDEDEDIPTVGKTYNQAKSEADAFAKEFGKACVVYRLRYASNAIREYDWAPLKGFADLCESLQGMAIAEVVYQTGQGTVAPWDKEGTNEREPDQDS